MSSSSESDYSVCVATPEFEEVKRSFAEGLRKARELKDAEDSASSNDGPPPLMKASEAGFASVASDSSGPPELNTSSSSGPLLPRLGPSSSSCSEEEHQGPLAWSPIEGRPDNSDAYPEEVKVMLRTIQDEAVNQSR